MSEKEKLYKPREICEIYNITPRTLLNWSYRGDIKFIRTQYGQRRYYLPDSEKPQKPGKCKGRYICYCRVSSHGQKKDLERQHEFFRSKFPNYEIITDIGSGINFKRKGLNKILELAKKGDIREVVVTHKDRLCRFGFELIEKIITEWSNGKIVVLNKEEMSPEQELSKDLISIITVFSSRLYGLRSNSIKRQIKEAIKQDPGKTNENNEI